MKPLILSLLYRLHIVPRPALTNRAYWQARADLARYLAAGIDTWRGPHGVEVSINPLLLDRLALLQQFDRYKWGRECDAAAARVLFATYDVSRVRFPQPSSGNPALNGTHGTPTARLGRIGALHHPKGDA